MPHLTLPQSTAPALKDELRPLGSVVGDDAAWEWSVRVTRSLWPPYERAVITRSLVHPPDVWALGRFVEAPRVARAEQMLRAMRAAGIRPYEPVVFDGADGLSVVFPPMVEARGASLTLIHGSHRLHVAQGEASIEVVLVGGSDIPPPPTTPIRWDQVRVAQGQVGRAEKFGDYRRELFRPGPELLHGDRWLFASEDELIAAVEETTHG